MVKNEKLSYSSMNQAACAAQFLFQTVLGHGHISTTGRYLHLISPQFRPPKNSTRWTCWAHCPRTDTTRPSHGRHRGRCAAPLWRNVSDPTRYGTSTCTR
jgi:hypothetical protein